MSLADTMSPLFVGIITKIYSSDFYVSYSFIIGHFDVVPALIDFTVFSLLLYPADKFFNWLYSASPKSI